MQLLSLVLDRPKERRYCLVCVFQSHALLLLVHAHSQLLLIVHKKGMLQGRFARNTSIRIVLQ